MAQWLIITVSNKWSTRDKKISQFIQKTKYFTSVCAFSGSNWSNFCTNISYTDGKRCDTFLYLGLSLFVSRNVFLCGILFCFFGERKWRGRKEEEEMGGSKDERLLQNFGGGDPG